MDILTIGNNNIKITAMLLTRFITDEHYNNNQVLIEFFMTEDQNIYLDNDIISLYWNNILILENCKILNIFKDNQSYKYNIFIKEK